MIFRILIVSIVSIVSFAFSSLALAQDLVSHAPVNARTYIIEPTDGAIVSETFKVKFGLSGMELAPAGVKQENTGHHHLLIDQPQFDLTMSLPVTNQIRHFGKAQTETELTLPPGEHTLQLILGNYAHIPHDHPVVSEPITVTVQ